MGIALYTGSALLAYGFGAYFNFLPGESFSAIMLIYGFPASLIGFALKYAQLDPVPCRTKPEAIPLRETKATDIQNQIREDVTRYRYGDEQHLDLALERVLMLGRYEGVSSRTRSGPRGWTRSRPSSGPESRLRSSRKRRSVGT